MVVCPGVELFVPHTTCPPRAHDTCDGDGDGDGVADPPQRLAAADPQLAVQVRG
jgi:hypothetical protein